MRTWRPATLTLALIATGLLPHLAPSGPLLAQATGDRAQLVFTVSAGYVGGRSLWAVNPQPISFGPPADTLALMRDIRGTLTVGFGGNYFPGEHLGITAEATLLGLGFADQCRQQFSSGSGAVRLACLDIQGQEKRASAIVASVGAIYRIRSRSWVSPYARANAGFVFSNQSSIRTIGRFPSDSGNVDLIIYDDDHDTRIAPAFALGVGFTVPVARGYQIRWEVRDNITGVQQVTGPAVGSGQGPGIIPPHQLVFKHLLGISVGFDVVLERRRGRRY
ncbi:MAG: hypothetical protein H0W67_02425 [Gemmatimonadales bacterium]|nr:hypothetical protein [Gemmatimonadales bacterium]